MNFYWLQEARSLPGATRIKKIVETASGLGGKLDRTPEILSVINYTVFEITRVCPD